MKQLLIFFFCISIFSCQKTENIPDPTSYIINKWWCAKPGPNSISSQYFKADGTWEQGSKGGSFNDTGKWALSGNKKKIVLSSIIDSNKKAKTGWEYEIETNTASNLILNWAPFSLKMDMIPCP